MGELIRSISGLQRPAILLGNGINMHAGLFQSWDDLLKDISTIQFDTEGLTNTEIYDFIELHSNLGNDLKYEVGRKLELPSDRVSEVHRRFVEIVSERDCPVLTTNFDFALENSFNSHLFRTKKTGFTRYYPWDMYYGIQQHTLPTDGFGIWHIHGKLNYFDSIRLGLSDYMGSVEYARKRIHNGDDRLFGGKNQNNWAGHKTWLHIWFNMPLIIVGLKLRSDEVFIRWLLIERARYFNRWPERSKETIFMCKRGSELPTNFLSNLNVDVVTVPEYGQLYS